MEKLDKVVGETKAVMRGILKDGIDMERMTMVLHREQRKVRLTLLQAGVGKQDWILKGCT